jgi:cobyrinic acid a,c-diamide synthase
MPPATIDARAAALFEGAGLVIGEGVMGLFDGAADGSGSTADLAARLGLSVVLVVDAGRQGASIAALVEGFARHRAAVGVAGVILNRVGSASHEALLRRALTPTGVAVLGALPRAVGLALPERHLGLVQAQEHAALEDFLGRAAAAVAAHVDLAALRALARPPTLAAPPSPPPCAIPPLGTSIAVARDPAFAFAYPHVLAGWQAAGVRLCFFSPLADEPPPRDCDAIYLPGGYPELHAVTLAAACAFLDGLRNAAARGAVIYGECGGYMALGTVLVDAAGSRHAMAGLLPLETSFAARRLQLGYRALALVAGGPLGAAGQRYRGHEFHYATVVHEGAGEPLFAAQDATGTPLGALGRRAGAVFGSFAHLIERWSA